MTLSKEEQALSVSTLAVLTASVSSVAFAADMGPTDTYIAPPAEPIMSADEFDKVWNSFSIGVGGGFNAFFSNVEFGTYDEYFYGNEAYWPDLAAAGSGAFGTVELGFDHKFGDAVFGVYGDAHISGASWDFSFDQYLGDYGDWGAWNRSQASLEFDHGFSLVGRIGHLATPSTLLYALGGYSVEHYNITAARFGDEDFSDLNSDDAGKWIQYKSSGYAHGPTFGVGVEQLFNNGRVSIKGEYRGTLLTGIEKDGDSYNYYDGNYLGAAIGSDQTWKHEVRAVLSLKLY